MLLVVWWVPGGLLLLLSLTLGLLIPEPSLFRRPSDSRRLEIRHLMIAVWIAGLGIGLLANGSRFGLDFLFFLVVAGIGYYRRSSLIDWQTIAVLISLGFDVAVLIVGLVAPGLLPSVIASWDW